MRLNASAGHTIEFSGRTWYEIRIRERKGPSRGVFQKGDTHERSPCVLEFEERTPEETSRREDFARNAASDLVKNISKAGDEATFYSPVKIKAPVLVSRYKEARMFVDDSGASMHMLSRKDLSSDELDTLRRSRNPTTMVTANGEVQTNEEAQEYVHDLDLFVTVQLLDETPAVLSLGNLCSEHGYSYEWKNGELPRLTKNGIKITCTMDNFVPLVVPGLSSSPSSSSASASKPKGQTSSSGESETSSETTRSAKPACGKPMQTNPDKQASGNRGSANNDARHS